jgi:hypothetical protein
MSKLAVIFPPLVVPAGPFVVAAPVAPTTPATKTPAVLPQLAIPAHGQPIGVPKFAPWSADGGPLPAAPPVAPEAFPPFPEALLPLFLITPLDPPPTVMLVDAKILCPFVKIVTPSLTTNVVALQS